MTATRYPMKRSPPVVVLGCQVGAMARRGTARDPHCQIRTPHAAELTHPLPWLTCRRRTRRGTASARDPDHYCMGSDAAESTHRCPWLSRRRSAQRETARDPHDPRPMPDAVESTHRRPWLTCWHPASTRNPTTSISLSLYGVWRTRVDPFSSLVDMSAPCPESHKIHITAIRRLVQRSRSILVLG